MTMQGMNAYDRHKKMVHDLVAYYGGQLPQGGQASAHWDDDGLGPHSTQQGPCVQVHGDSGRPACAHVLAQGWWRRWEHKASRYLFCCALLQAAPAKSDWDILRDNFRCGPGTFGVLGPGIHDAPAR